MLALCHHLLLQGYSAQDIVILTTCLSQQHYLKKVSTACFVPAEGPTADIQMLTVMLTNMKQPMNKLHGIVLEELTVPQLVRKFQIFYTTLLCPQEPVTCPCIEPDESSPCYPIPFLYDTF